jgi:hypothetical protein
MNVRKTLFAQIVDFVPWTSFTLIVERYSGNVRVPRIRFKDPDSGKTLVFLTNNMLLPPLTVAALYKSRWH